MTQILSRWAHDFNKKLQELFHFEFDLPAVFIDTFHRKQSEHEVAFAHHPVDKLLKRQQFDNKPLQTGYLSRCNVVMLTLNWRRARSICAYIWFPRRWKCFGRTHWSFGSLRKGNWTRPFVVGIFRSQTSNTSSSGTNVWSQALISEDQETFLGNKLLFRLWCTNPACSRRI